MGRPHPHEFFCRVRYANECLSSLPWTGFVEQNVVADRFQAKLNFSCKLAVLRFADVLWET